ncbi:MAG TPA: autotransporter-associated beta strand repeat-containing protein, partial [Pirellulales bacterium]|nr:autotransporter-associated beta strand repeat-containing protein [Pirellulales bacterium]
ATFSGSLQDGSASTTLSLTKSGAGTETLTGNSNTYSGGTTVNGGTLLVNNTAGSGTGVGSVNVNNSATLGGTGVISGAVNINNTAHLAPGTSPGILGTGSATFASGTSFDVEINGTTVGTQYDQLNVTGTAALGGANLNLSGSYTPAVSDSFTIIQTSVGVTPQFAGLPQGADVFLNLQPLTVDYTANSSKNVVLSFDSTPTIEGGAGVDNFTVMLDGSGNVVVKDGPTTIMSTPQSSLSSLTINGNGGTNTLTVDESNGILSIPVTFNGGGAGGMTVTGYSGVQVTDTYTGTGPGHSGTVQIGAGGLISYTGLAPLSLSGTASDLIIDLSQTGVANTDVVVGDDGTLADPDVTNDVNTSAIYSASNAFEYTQFTNPTNSLTVKTGSLGDTVTLAALDSAFAAAAVNLNGSASAEIFNVEATPASATTTVSAANGLDTINVSSDGAALTGNLDAIDGLLKVDAGATASDVLNISESGSATADTVTVTATSYAGTAGGGWNIQEINFGFSGGVHLSLGSAGDTVQVLSTLSAQPLTINGNGGADTFNVSSDAPTNTGDLLGLDGSLAIDGGAGSNTLNVSESGSAAADTVLVTSSQISSAITPFTINYSATGGTFAGGINLFTGSVGDTVNVQSTLAGGTTSINTGGGADVINVSSNAPTNTGDLLGLDGSLAIDGGTGSNTLNVSESGSAAADTVLVTSSQISSAITPFSISYSATGGTFGGGVNLSTGSAGDTINVQSTLAGGTTSINSGAGNDTINVSSNAPLLTGNLDGIAGQLNIDAQ